MYDYVQFDEYGTIKTSIAKAFSKDSEYDFYFMTIAAHIVATKLKRKNPEITRVNDSTIITTQKFIMKITGLRKFRITSFLDYCEEQNLFRFDRQARHIEIELLNAEKYLGKSEKKKSQVTL